MKRVLALALTLAFFCAALSVIFSAMPKNPFLSADRTREKTMRAALSSASPEADEKYAAEAARRENEAGGCIVSFKNSVSLAEISRRVSRYEYRLLADSEKRLFWVGASSSAFAAENSDVVENSENDRLLTFSAAVDDPLAPSQWELDYLQAYGAWDITTGDRAVTVAVLDSGVHRSHPDFENVSILAGYDAVERRDGVADDVNGHGTAIVSIIAAAADNGVGMAGVAGNVSILPVRVCDSTGYIHSSDFIEAVYYAADLGADIINMSFGGYAYSDMEAVAVQYANEKGCVLVSAAGNQEVSTQYAGMKAYPASYDGVISVGAVDSNGMLCTFSQRNDDVDLVAPGENVTVANTEDGYERVSGTSFASAYVSAVAALCLSAIDDGCAFNSDQFLSLVAGVNGAEKTEGYGYGDINAEGAVKNVNIPLVAGVVDGGVYHKNIAISFNRGTARLDGKAFKSGSSVITSGSHSLEVRDGKITLKLNFITDNIPLKYDYAINADGASVSFTRGTATMDGLPYLSGAPVTASGRHRFKLTGPYGNTENYDFECSFDAPTVFGVENGGYYSAPVQIKASGGGELTLNGTAVSSGTVVSESGDYLLASSAADGYKKNYIRFTVSLPAVRVYDSPMVSPRLIADGKQHVLMLYNDTLPGVRVISLDEPLRTRSFIRTRFPVIGSAFSEDKAALIHNAGISVCRRDALTSGAAELLYFAFEKSASAVASYGGYVYYVCALGKEAQLWRMDIETGQSTLLTDFQGKADCLSTDGFSLAAASSDGEIFVFGQNGTLKRKINFGGNTSALAVSGEYLCTDSCVYDLNTGEKLFSLGTGERVLLAKNGVLVTDCTVYGLEERRPLGVFGKRLSDLVITESGFVCKAFENVKIETVSVGNETLNPKNAAQMLNAAALEDAALGEKERFSVYEEYIKTPENWSFSSAAISEEDNAVYAVSPDERVLCVFDRVTLRLRRKLQLRFTPSYVCAYGGYIYISFSDESAVFELKTQSRGEDGNGRYLRCAQPYTKLLRHGNKLYALNAKGDLFAFSLTLTELEKTVIRSQNVIDFICVGDYIYAYLKPMSLPFIYKIRADGYSVKATLQVSENAERIFAASGKLFLGRKAYDSSSLKFEYRLSGAVKAAYKSYFITENGVYFADTGRLIGDLRVPSSLPLFDGHYNYYSFEKGRIYKITNVRGDLHSLPDINGVIPDCSQRGPVRAEFPFGFGYLDGEPYASGGLIENGGLHRLVVALPFGVSKSFEFVIEARINSILLSAEKSVISVNESTRLNVTAHPRTYGVVSVSYTADNDCVLIHTDGSVIGTKVGKCIVTATTADGLHSATTELNVTKGELKFDSSYFYADTSRRTVKGISPGTSVEAFFAAASETNGEIVIRASGGVNVSAGVIHTGMKAELLNVNEEIIDSWQLSVTGDIDGDGYITADDWYTLRQALKNPDSMPYAVAAAADTDGDGVPTAFDLFALKEYLLGNLSLGEQRAYPERIANTKAHLMAPRLLAPGTDFTAGLTLTEMKNAVSVSGVLRWDGARIIPSELKIIGAYSESFYSIGENELYFFADLLPSSATAVMLTAEFNVPEDAVPETKVSLFCTDLVIYDGAAAYVDKVSVAAGITENPPADVLIFNLPDYVFDDKIYENRCLFPSGTQKVCISAYPAENCDIAGNTSFGLGSKASFAVVVGDGEGTRQYDYICEREKGAVHPPVEPGVYKNGNADLAALAISGAVLIPSFDKNVTDYYAAVDLSGLKVEAKPESELSTVKVSDYDSATGTVFVLCTAEDGGTKTYLLRITESFSLCSSEKSAGKSWSVWFLSLSAAALLFGAAAYAALAVKRSKERKRRL